MILSGLEIAKEYEKGNIYISDFSMKQVNPNSYNLKLHNELLVYTDDLLDMKKVNPVERLIIPEDGLILEPGKLYLGRTVERTHTSKFVPMLEGRSSIGRLGIAIHVTAGFGDIGFDGTWTLEIFAKQPAKIYPFVEIGQIYFHTIQGEFHKYESGKYQGQQDIMPSRLYRDFEQQ